MKVITVAKDTLKKGFLLYTASFPSFFLPFSSKDETHKGECILPRQDIFGDTFSLGDATFLFYVNKSLGAEEGRGLSVNFDY